MAIDLKQPDLETVDVEGAGSLLRIRGRRLFPPPARV